MERVLFLHQNELRHGRIKKMLKVNIYPLFIFFLLFFITCNNIEPLPEKHIPPTPVILYPIVYEDGNYIVSWTKNVDDDFVSYTLLESEQNDMSSESIFFRTNIREDTLIIIEGIYEGNQMYYQIEIVDEDSLYVRSNITYGSSPLISFRKDFGGIGNDIGYSVKQTADGGLIIVGSTDSWGNGETDIWLIKTNNEGIEEWDKTFGGEEGDWGASVQNTNDGGLIIVGSTDSWGNGETDLWLIKTNNEGIKEWDKTFGGGEGDWGTSVQQTADNGFIILVHTLSFGNGYYYIFMIKTDSEGNEIWVKTFGGNEEDFGYSVIQTSDGGYILVGFTVSFGSGNKDVWIIKTDSQGNEEWNKTYGGSEREIGFAVEQTSDDGFIITGLTETNTFGLYDILLIKTDINGENIWEKNIGNGNYEVGSSVKQTQDGGFIITGYTISYGNGAKDIWLVKTDPVGEIEWDRTFGGIHNDGGHDVFQTNSGGFIVLGYTESSGNGQKDFKLIKTTPLGF